jgi:hypothetical protein
MQDWTGENSQQQIVEVSAGGSKNEGEFKNLTIE